MFWATVAMIFGLAIGTAFFVFFLNLLGSIDDFQTAKYIIIYGFPSAAITLVSAIIFGMLFFLRR